MGGLGLTITMRSFPTLIRRRFTSCTRCAHSLSLSLVLFRKLTLSIYQYASDFYSHEIKVIVLGYIRPELDYVSKGRLLLPSPSPLFPPLTRPAPTQRRGSDRGHQHGQAGRHQLARSAELFVIPGRRVPHALKRGCSRCGRKGACGKEQAWTGDLDANISVSSSRHRTEIGQSQWGGGEGGSDVGGEASRVGRRTLDSKQRATKLPVDYWRMRASRGASCKQTVELASWERATVKRLVAR